MDRLDKVISSQTEFSRKDVKKLVNERRIKVNGILVNKSDIKIDPQNTSILIDNEILEVVQNIYLVLNKPKGYVSAIKDKKDLTVIDLIPEKYLSRNIFPVGRLDKDTTGLLLLTDDGNFAHNITSPKKHIKKVYEVLTDIELTENMIKKFKSGIELNDGKCEPALLEITGKNTALVTISEGRYHQIKRMFGCVGAKVLELKRIKIGQFILPDDLAEGQVRTLTNLELIKILDD